MKAEYTSFENFGGEVSAPVVAIGNFDGVHRGHRAIVDELLELASSHSTSAVVLTFEPHPTRFFYPDAPPFRLTPRQQKRRLLLETGVDSIFVLEFTSETAEKPPAEFVETILDESLGAIGVVVGDDFRFGKGRAGDTEQLRELAADRNMETRIVDPVEVEGERISSTWIRKTLARRDLEEVRRLLGRPFQLIGEVVEGDGRGRELGYPTANIDTPNRLLPPHGVYASELHVGDETYTAATSIGTRPTFQGDGVAVECYTIDESELDLYGAEVRVDLWKFIREQNYFEEVDELIDQMDADIEAVRQFWPPPAQS